MFGTKQNKFDSEYYSKQFESIPVSNGRRRGIHSVIHIEMGHPLGVTVHQDEVFVCDPNESQVHVYRPTGEFVRQWHWSEGFNDISGEDTGVGFSPQYIAVHGQEAFVTDASRHEILVFLLDGSFVRRWGSYGTEEGRFDRPAGVAMRGKEVIVCDYGNQRIQTFQLNGLFVRQWYSADPVGVTIDDNDDIIIASHHQLVQYSLDTV